MVFKQQNVTLDIIDIASAPTTKEESQPETPSTHPGTPSLASLSLTARAALLNEAAEKAPKPSITLVWPEGSQPPGDALDDALDDDVWQEILVKFGASGVPAANHARHFENIVKHGMDANAVPFPPMESRKDFGKIVAALPDDGMVSLPCQDVVPFPLFGPIDSAKNQWTTDAEREAFEWLLAGRATEAHELREAFYKEPPLDMELVSWPTLENGAVAADVCSESQARVWMLRTDRPLSPEQVEKRRTVLAKRLKGELNRRVFEEVRPTLEREAALLELQATHARDKAEEARLYDELAEQGATSVAWVVPNERRWPEQPQAWKRRSKWLAMWRAQPIVASTTFAFMPMKRSSSESSLQSWAAVSDVSWVEIESKASECSWQDVLDEQMLPLKAAHPAIHLKKEDITELKCMCTPPQGVKLTMEVICILLQVPPKKLQNGFVDYWEPAKQLLGDVGFFDRLSTVDDVPASVLDVLAPYMSHPDFMPESIQKQSKACKGLCIWAREVYKYNILGQASAEATRQSFAQKPSAELLVESMAALDCLSKSALQELKSLGKPPSGVDDLCCCLLHLFAGIAPEVELTKKGNVKAPSWKQFQKFCSDPSKMLKQLSELRDAIDAGKVPQRNIEKVRRIQISMGRALSADAMRQKSVAAASLCDWLNSIIAYYDLASPKQQDPAVTQEAPRSKAFRSDANKHALDLKALPALEMAAQALEMAAQALDKKDIGEIKAMTRPPQPVMIVCMCVCILRPLGKEDESAGWAGAKQMLSDMSLLKALQEYKKDDMKEEQIANIRKLLNREKEVFEGDRMKSVSKAGFGLLQWVLAMVKYYDVAKGVEPKKDARE